VVKLLNFNLGVDKMQTSSMQNELLKEISEKTGLRFSEKGQSIGGTYEEYNITINYLSNRFYINIPIRTTNEYGVNEINRFLSYIGNKYKSVTSAQYVENSVKMQCLEEIKQDGQEHAVVAILKEIVKFAKDGNLVTCCEDCGQNNYVVPYMKDGFLVPSCVKCQLQEKEADSASQKSNNVQGTNLIKGIIGAVIGAFLGTIVWVLIAQTGHMAYVGGLAIAVGVIKGYEILGHGMDKKGLIVSIGIIILTVYFAQYASYGFAFYNEMKKYDLKIDMFGTFKYYLKSPEVSRVFHRDLAFGYLFTIVPTVYYIKSKYR